MGEKTSKRPKHKHWAIIAAVAMTGVIVSSCHNLLGPGSIDYYDKILFTSSRSGTPQLYMMNPDGSGVQQLTTGPYSHYDGKWSPEAKQIVAMTDEDWNTACPAHLVVFNVNGTNQKLVGCGGHPSWSPGGKEIAFSYMPRGELGDLTTYIYVVNVDSGTVEQLTNNLGVIDDDPAWSPDGSTIAFDSDRDYPTGPLRSEIYLMNPDGSNQRRLTYTDSLINGAPVWSPDGNTIAFESNGGIALINIDGTNMRYITHQYEFGFGGYGSPIWSPDGGRLVILWYPSDGTSHTVIFTLNSDGSGMKEILDDSTAHATDWSR